MPTRQKSPWFLWPFMLVWDLLALVLRLIGRVLAGILGLALMIFGITLITTVSGAPIGVPFAVLGFLLMIRSIF